MKKTVNIVKEILSDSEKGAALLVSAYRNRLYTAALGLCKNPFEAEDLVFRTFEQVIAKIETCKDENSFYSWMYAILLNLYRKSVRGSMIKNTIPVGGWMEMDALGGTTDVSESLESLDGDVVRAALERISPEMREVLMLHYFDGQPLSRVAKYLSVSVGTVKSRLYYARMVLARRLNEQVKRPAVAMVAAALIIAACAATVAGLWMAVTGEGASDIAVSAPIADGGAMCSAQDEMPCAQSDVGTGNAQIGVAGATSPFIEYFGNQFANTHGETAMIPKARNAALLLATSFMFGVANAEPLGSGLAAYYTFDEAQMTNLVPGSAVTGVTLSESGIVSGVTSGEFRHAGFGGYLDVNEGWARLDGSQNLEFENGNDFAICIWMRAEEWPVNDPAFVGNGSWSATTTPGTLLSFFSQGVACNYSYLENGEATRKRINGPAQLGKWIFYAISHTSDGKYSFYYSNADGSLTRVWYEAPALTLAYDAVQNRRPFYLGQDGTGAYSYKFTGKLDEFALWTRGLSQSDVETVFRNGRKGRTLKDLLKPVMEVEDRGGGTVGLSFSGVRNGTYDLCVASGGSDGGTDRFAWDHFDLLSAIAPADTNYTFALPDSFRNEGRYYRFFLTKARDYQEVEYVENTGEYDTGSSYFTTPVIPTSDTSVQGELSFSATGNGTWRNVFGCSDSRFFQLGVHNSSAPYEWYTEIRKLESGGNTFMGEVVAGTRYAFDFRATNMTVWDTSDAGDATSMALLSPSTAFADMSSPITVFRCTRSSGSIYDRPFTGRIYEFEIFTNGVVACDYVPAMNAMGTIGFYDTVAHAFCPSESATAFTGGSVEIGRLTVQSATTKAMTPSDPVSACWVGGPNGTVDDPGSWICVNSYGARIDVVPTLLTDISVSSASQMFNVPPGSGFECKSIVIGAPIALTGDCDWRGVDFAKVVSADAIDLAGHKFHLSATADYVGSVLFTDSVGGGELHVCVPANGSADNAWLSLSGSLALVKDGGGTLVASRRGQTFTGGVRIADGVLKTTAFISTRVLGPSGSKVVVGSCGTLRIENGSTGLEDYDLELAGGTLHFYNGAAISGRTSVGSLTLTANSTIRSESVLANDSACDVEIAEASVWNLGGCELTVETMTSETDLFVGRDKTVKPVFRNGTITLPSQVGCWQDYGSDASDHVRYVYGAKYPRQRADSSAYDFVNNIPSEGSNFSNDGTMSIFGTYTPNSDMCSKIRMMNGSTIDLGGRTGAWPMLGGNRPMTFEQKATVKINLGTRRISQDEKIISWSSVPSGVKFVDPTRGWSLLSLSDGLYAARGFKIIIR